MDFLWLKTKTTTTIPIFALPWQQQQQQQREKKPDFPGGIRPVIQVGVYMLSDLVHNILRQHPGEADLVVGWADEGGCFK